MSVPVVPLKVAPYPDMRARWPRDGRHVLAHADETSLIVYQAYRPEIGQWAIAHQCLGGPDFSFTRMSWIKPNFLWMMFRSGWGTKTGQEVTLALRIRRTFFESLLGQAVASTFGTSGFETEEDWKRALGRSGVRLQWDPDHGPGGQPLARRAIQLGLRGTALPALGSGGEVLEILDMSPFVAEQRDILASAGVDGLCVPVETVYVPADPTLGARLGLEATTAGPGSV